MSSSSQIRMIGFSILSVSDIGVLAPVKTLEILSFIYCSGYLMLIRRAHAIKSNGLTTGVRW